ncbi:hypothetical protein AXK11_08405 [Cephaloticoccus primus]|uniref:Import component protein n=1 Tax=Cephaloticoccus primus TaxID=1548207 RepID=A0A139SIV4_9BACT|nr:hypothetical protein AXK11_08405 [Cephaloticoccus primus]
MAILSYLTIVGLIVALVMHNQNKTELGAYHLRQSLGLIITAIAVGIVFLIVGMIPIVNLILIILAPLVGVGFLVLFVLGLVSAVKGEQKPLPLVGASYQSWLANAFV